MTTSNLTQGPILRAVVRFALPFLASYLLQTLYGLCDLFLVGRYALVADTTAVAIGSQVMHIITVITVGLATGTTVLVGRATGAGDKGEAARVAGNTAVLFAVISVVGAIVFLALSPVIIRALSTPVEAVPPALSYVNICFLGIPAIASYNAAASVLRGMGDSKSPLWVVAAASTVNIALDCLFIGALDMGARGAAIATVISQVLSALIAILFLRRRMAGSIHIKDFVPSISVMRSLLAIGVPVMLQDGFIQLSFIVITVIANLRGITDAAAVGIVEKVIGIMFLVPSSMLSTVSVLSAQCIGALNEERARGSLAVCIKISLMWGVALCALTMPFAPHIVGIFTHDGEVARSGGEYLRSYVWDCILAGVHFCMSGYFCALGKSYLSFIHNSISAFLVRIPLAWLLSAHFASTLLPMGFAPPAGSLVSIILCAWFYRRIAGRPLCMEQQPVIHPSA